MQPLQICIGPNIRIGRESWCLSYAGFLRTVIALGYFLRCFFFINWVIRYVLKQILVVFKTNFGCFG